MQGFFAGLKRSYGANFLGLLLKRTIMKKYLVFAALIAFVWACGGGDSGSDNTTASSQAAEIDGEKIYKQNCVTCHGLYGDMGASGAFNLTTTELTLEERVEVITNGRNAMTPFGNLLSPEKIKAVAEYTFELQK